jgi:hypothetical protein
MIHNIETLIQSFQMSTNLPHRVCIKKSELIKRGCTDFEDWSRNPKHLYIGRNMSFYVKGAHASKWCNPFKLTDYTSEESLSRYRQHILLSSLNYQLSELSSYSEIGCWCLPGEPCHGNVLLDLLDKIEKN